MQGQVVFTRHSARQVPGRNGTFTVHEFFTSDETKFETTKQDIANAAYALLNQSVSATYDEVQNGQWTNRRLTAVQAADGALAPGVMPSGSQPAPTSSGGLPLAPAISPAPVYVGTGNGGRAADDAAPRIARAVAFEHLPEYMAAGLIDPTMTVDELYNVLGGFAKWIFKGSRPSVVAAAPTSSGAVGETTGAASAAPASADLTPEADDGIPF